MPKKYKSFLYCKLHPSLYILRRSMLAQWACFFVLCFGQKSYFKYKMKGDEKNYNFLYCFFLSFFNLNVFVYVLIFMFNYFPPFMLNCPYVDNETYVSITFSLFKFIAQ